MEEIAKMEAQERAKLKKALQNAKKKLRDAAKTANYWTEDSGQQLALMEHLERICLACEIEEITEVYQKLEKVDGYDAALNILSQLVIIFLILTFLG